MDRSGQPPASHPPAPTAESAPGSSSHNNESRTIKNADHNVTDASKENSIGANNATTDTPADDNAAASHSNPTAPVTPNAENPALGSDRVQIILKDQSGNQIAFGVKSSTRMEKVMTVYADKVGRALGTLRFYFDGTRVLPEHTVAAVTL